jgi:hypothetical protein
MSKLLQDIDVVFDWLISIIFSRKYIRMHMMKRVTAVWVKNQFTINASPRRRINYQAIVSRTWNAISEESTFFYNGIKKIYHETKLVGTMNDEIFTKGISKASRTDMQFIHRVHMDQVKVIPFILLSFIPFSTVILVAIAWAFPFVLPSTLQKPTYRIMIRERQEQYRKREVFEIVIGLTRIVQQNKDPRAKFLLDVLDDHTMLPFDKISKIVQFESFFHEHLHLQQLPSHHLTYLLNFYYTSKSNAYLPKFLKVRYLRYIFYDIQQDDVLINSNDQMAKMTVEEIKEALHQRGFQLEEFTDTQLIDLMGTWISLCQNVRSKSLLLHIGPLIWETAINKRHD